MDFECAVNIAEYFPVILNEYQKQLIQIFQLKKVIE